MGGARVTFFPARAAVRRSGMLYGHFIEHFHRQIYGGVYDPGNPLSDEDGFRTDVLEALRRIRVPVLRWPGGCFVSSYHWKKAVGPRRTPFFDKAWRVEDPNLFGTDEYAALCRKLGCEGYICTNAGTGTPEEMSDWVEYCNLESEGEFARMRIANGHPEPYRIKYWSIGNENYGWWEIGARSAGEWGRLVLESAKMMKHVDPRAELSAAALTDIDWDMELLRQCGQHLDWLSIHKYWNLTANENALATYEETLAYTNELDTDLRRVRGLLTALGLEKRIRIAYDEWNLRGWHHPGVHTLRQAVGKEEYLAPRDLNDRNADYTMADAVFTACFLHTLNRNADIVGMACFAPAVNTRGCIFTHRDGIVLRSTYHVFDLYVRCLGDEILTAWTDDVPLLDVRHREGRRKRVEVLDILPTRFSSDGHIAVGAVNKHPERDEPLLIDIRDASAREWQLITVNGDSTEAYNDIGHTGVTVREGAWQPFDPAVPVTLPAHSVNVIRFR